MTEQKIMKQFEVGDNVNIILKPVLLREWFIIKETKKCLVIRKTFHQRYGHTGFIGDCHYVPKKEIVSILKQNVSDAKG